ncbi:hypothetical protein AOQ71_31555 [Bradyrhizobium manausense]|uniref:UvrD-like helicase C-terminal domain-containing protein n=1 Tax=Bradyrhizobium manausense TaxID=989370 RepID=A0A0R3D788_9BRAD|nr:hypothetical protein AOQ71_31555 [Bradyrhizobium manausense]
MLSPDQEHVVSNAAYWWHSRSDMLRLSIGGLAGTGKTSIIMPLVARLGLTMDDVAVVAPTWKAALVLRKKGFPDASSIHGIIYGVPKVVARDDDGETLEWVLKDADLANKRLIVVDESSMVGARIGSDLEKTARLYHLRIVTFGDPGQLQPVEDSPWVIQPDLLLTQVHRQAAGSAIVQAAYYVRNGGTLQHCRLTTEAVQYWDGVTKYRPQRSDVFLCDTRALCDAINDFLKPRAVPLGLPDELVTARDNVRAAGIINGTDIPSSTKGLRLLTAVQNPDRNAIKAHWERVKRANRGDPTAEIELLKEPHGPVFASWGWARTIHKAQGSEWPRVVVVCSEGGPPDYARAVYTALTRAKQELIFLPARALDLTR